MKDHRFPSAFFITGTDTGVGKTIVAATLVRALSGAYFKPVQSGLDTVTDTETVKAITGLPDSHFFPETYRLTLPLSPHLAARMDHVSISVEDMRLPDYRPFPHLIVEGAGGVMAPLNDTQFILDLMVRLDIPVLLVARSGLGTINHTLLSLNMMRQNGLKVFGVVMNGPLNPGNKEAIEHFGKVAVIAEIPPVEMRSPDPIATLFHHFFKDDKGDGCFPNCPRGNESPIQPDPPI